MEPRRSGSRRLYCGPACCEWARRLRQEAQRQRDADTGPADPGEVDRLLGGILRRSTTSWCPGTTIGIRRLAQLLVPDVRVSTKPRAVEGAS